MMAKTRTRRKHRTGASRKEGEQPLAGPTGAGQEGGADREETARTPGGEQEGGTPARTEVYGKEGDRRLQTRTSGATQSGHRPGAKEERGREVPSDWSIRRGV